MNPPAAPAPSRFVRGRARGGGGYRPYFYFRRNGRTIPAGRGPNQNAAESATALTKKGSWRGRARSNKADTSSSRPITAQLDSSFLRPECYAAPEDALHAVQSIATDSPLQCPGWRLYFPCESYEGCSELVKRINAVEQHYSSNAGTYNLLQIQRARSFVLQANIVTNDAVLMQIWPSVVQDMRLRPQRTLATFGVAMHAAVTLAVIDNSISLQPCSSTVYVPRTTRARKIYVRPRGFRDVDMLAHLDNTRVDSLCCVRGTVTAIGAVEASASWIAYKCARCRQEQAMRQSGYFVTRPYSCKRDGCLAKKNFIEQRSSPYTRITPMQVIRLSENQINSLDLDKEQLNSLDIELCNDLVDSVVCGQDVIITGILKMRALIDQDSAAHSNEIYLKAVSVLDAKRVKHGFSDRDMEAISAINAEPDSFKLLVHSLAPELHGHELVKAGVLLSLFGGGGSQIHEESEINVLLVGDPGIGKSHLLEMCAKISCKGALISGKRGTAASKALTAVIQGRSNYNINTGAVLASAGGHCGIDDIDRLATQQDTLLQVLQSQSISLPFPSIYATIATPTSIIATANSLRGHYDHSKLLKENTRLTPALLRQFHLIYLLLDKPNKDLDTSLTEHIKALQAGAKKSATITARFAMKTKANNSVNLAADEMMEDDENYDLNARLKLKCINNVEEEELDLLPPILMKKFIAYARQQVKPLLNAEAAAALKAFYMSLRENEAEENKCSISTSHLEGLVRLTQARARIDFSCVATKAHLRDVICLVRHSVADTSVSDYVDTNGATASAANSQRSAVKRFIQMLQLRSSALGRRVFDYSELKEMASHAGILCGVNNLVDVVNLQGYLLKKGPNLYEVMAD